MKKEEYKERAMNIRSLAEEQKFKAAADLADSIDWNKVRSVKMLGLVSDIYKAIRRYQDSRDIMLLAYQHAPEDSKLVYYLCELNLKLGDFIGAMECYKEFVRLAPQDPGRYVLQYKIYETQDVSLEERAAVLEELKKHKYVPKWGYELAYLYHRMGMESACVQQCDEMASWFCRGSYVVKALELKNLHAPLTNEQYDILAREKPGTYFERPGDLKSETTQETAEMAQPFSATQASLQSAEERGFGRSRQVDFKDYQGFRRPATGQETAAEPESVNRPWEVAGQELAAEPAPVNRPWEAAGQELAAEPAPVNRPWEVAGQELAAEPLPVNRPWEVAGQRSETEVGGELHQAPVGQEGFGSKQEPEQQVTFASEQAIIETAGIPLQQLGGGATGQLSDSYFSKQPVVAEQKSEKSPQQSEEQRLDSLLLQRATLPQQQGTNGHFDEMLEMDGDGQMSLLIPEGEPEDEQVTGQISIDDIMAKLREENETKVEERVSQIVHGRTDGMFHSFERSVREEHDFFAGGVIRPEKPEKNVIHPNGNIIPFAFSGNSETAANALEAIARQAALDAEHSASGSERNTTESMSVRNSESDSIMENRRSGEVEEQSVSIPAAEEPVDGEAGSLTETEQKPDMDPEVEPEKAAEKIPEKASEETLDKTLDSTPDKAAAKVSEKLSEEGTEERTAEHETFEAEEEPAKDTNQEEIPAEEPEEVLEKDSEETPEEVSEKLSGEGTEERTAEQETSEAVEASAKDTDQEEIPTEALEEEPEEEGFARETLQEEKEKEQSGGRSGKTAKARQKHRRRRDREEGRRDQKATVSEGNVAARIEGLSEQEKKLYGKFLHNHDTCNQIVLAIDALSADPSMGNAAVTGKDDEETLNLAQGLIRSIAVHNENFSGKVAKIKGDTLPAVQTEEFLEQLENGAMIITGASRLTRDTRKELIRVLSEKKKHVLVILIDTQKHIVDLLNRNPVLRDLFHVQVNAERLNVEGLVAYGREYAREREYAIDHMGILALHSRIEELQTYDHQVTTEEVMKIVDEAIEKRDRKNLSKLFDTLSHKLYDEDDMIILGEKNFLP